MYVLKASGRLGNQFMQYCFCRYMREIRGKDIYYDTSALKYHLERGYELEKIMNIKDLSISNIKKLRSFGIDSIEFPPQIVSSVYWKKQKKRMEEKGLFININEENVENIESCDKDIMFGGYFIDHKYYDEIRNILKKEFEFKGELGEKNKKICEEIENTNSVGIHIRQGDYKLIKELNVCDKLYYQSAIRTICEKTQNANFFVFSDEKVKEILPQNYNYIFVKGNEGMDAYKDIWLMTKCKHLIISNSTFSFMAALLNENEGYTVVPSCYKVGTIFNGWRKEWIKI